LDEGRIARLRQEIASAGRLDHRSIVKVFEYGEDSEWAYVAMEFVEGWPLRNGRLSTFGPLLFSLNHGRNE
jgi:hypothetical protein